LTAERPEASRPSTDRSAFRAVVRGRVQGVGFRDFVYRQATTLGLSGSVRNLDDGRSVEVQAAGPRWALERLLERLRDGPRLAHVSSVSAEWLDDAPWTGGFEIHY
jgi:acylphosphatase